MKKIITCGEAMALFVATEVGSIEEVSTFTKYTAGAEMNVAVGLARLGFESYYSAQLGTDPLGKYVKNTIAKMGVKTDYVYLSEDDLTGFMIKEKVVDGDPFVASYRKNSAGSKLNKETVKDIDFSTIDHIHLSGIFLALSDDTRAVSEFFVENAKKYNIPITFDPNLRPKLWKNEQVMRDTINEMAKHCDIVMPGISEGLILTGHDKPELIADYYINNGAKAVVIKLGADGAYIKDKDGNEEIVKGFKVTEIVDTVGAGDGFAVGVISGLVEGLPLSECAKRGNAIGAIQLGSPSDNEGLPTREQLFKFME